MPNHLNAHDLLEEISNQEAQRAVVDAERLLAALVAGSRPEWHRLAACRGDGPEKWMPDRGGALADLRTICQRCPVVASCLRSEITAPGPVPVAGTVSAGLTRRQVASARRLVTRGTPVEVVVAAVVDAIRGGGDPAEAVRPAAVA